MALLAPMLFVNSVLWGHNVWAFCPCAISKPDHMGQGGAGMLEHWPCGEQFGHLVPYAISKSGHVCVVVGDVCPHATFRQRHMEVHKEVLLAPRTFPNLVWRQE